MSNDNNLIPQQTIFNDIERFEFAQRVAAMFSKSTMVPDHFRNNIGNCMIAMDYACRINASPFMVMQNMYVIHGKPGIEAKLVIALLNQSDRFEPLQYDEIGNLSKPEKDTDGCIAWATEKKTGKKLLGPIVDWNMVKAEGWYSKTDSNGNAISKWKTISRLMFRYRAASYFIKTYCPEILFGMQTAEELNDIVTMIPKDGIYKAQDISGTDKFIETIQNQDSEPALIESPASDPTQEVFEDLWKNASRQARMYAGENSGCKLTVNGYGKPTKKQRDIWVEKCQEYNNNMEEKY